MFSSLLEARRDRHINRNNESRVSCVTHTVARFHTLGEISVDNAPETGTHLCISRENYYGVAQMSFRAIIYVEGLSDTRIPRRPGDA